MVDESLTSIHQINSGPFLLFCGNYIFKVEQSITCEAMDVKLHLYQVLIDKTMHTRLFM